MSRKYYKGPHDKQSNIKQTGRKHPEPVAESITQTVTEQKKFFEKPQNLAFIVVIFTFIAFFPCLNNDFVNTWDDNNYVTQNPKIQSLDGTSIKLMFSRQVNGTYVPLPLLTYAIEYKLFGKDPAPFHWTNLLIHILSVLLIFKLFRLLKLDPFTAAFGALLFGIHPMRVESVAWISERKDVLYVLFYIASLVCYVRFIRRDKRKSLYFWLSLVFALFSLLSKIEAVTIPLSMLLIDYFLERPIKFRLIIEKIPFFFLSLLFGGLGVLIILWVNKKSGLLRMNEVIGFGDRIMYAIYALNGYIVKFFAPVRQSAIYPYPEFTGAYKLLFQIMNPLFLGILVYLVYRTIRYSRTIIFGTLLFLVSIIFLLQIFSVGHGFFADRYTYIPYTGFIFIAAWYSGYLIKRSNRLKIIVISMMAIISVTFMAITFQRCKVWKNDETLWTNVIQQFPGKLDWSHANRAVYYMNNNQPDKSTADFSAAIRINPDCEVVYSNRGILWGLKGEYRKAISDFSRAVLLDPHNLKSLNNRGVAYGNLGMPDSAIADFSRVISIDPAYLSAYLNLGRVYFRQKEFSSSIDICMKGLKIAPQRAEFYVIIGNCYLEMEDHENAINTFNKGLNFDESDFDAMLGLAVAYYMKNDKVNAKKCLNIAKQTNEEIQFGMAGIKTLEKSGYFFGERKKETLKQMFMEL